jgi:type II secretory pathway component PulM
MSTLPNPWTRLTPRERLLVAILGGLAVTIGAIWFGLLPGLDAVSAAESRRNRAAAETAYVQQLAGQVTAARERAAALDVAGAQPVIADAALEYGLQLLSSTVENGDIRVEVDAPGSARLLEWLDVASARAAFGVRSMTLRRGEGGALVAVIQFSRTAP